MVVLGDRAGAVEGDQEVSLCFDVGKQQSEVGMVKY